MLSLLNNLVCCRCEEMLEDAVRISGGRRCCTACVCHRCGSEPFRFVDIDNDDQHLCVPCTRMMATPDMRHDYCAICDVQVQPGSDFCDDHAHWFICDACDRKTGTRRFVGTLGQPLCGFCYGVQEAS